MKNMKRTKKEAPKSGAEKTEGIPVYARRASHAAY